MGFQRIRIHGTPNFGVYILATETYALIPTNSPAKMDRFIRENLEVPVFRSEVAGSVVIGSLIAGNSHGLLLPRISAPEEVKTIRSATGVNIELLKSMPTAIGNLIAANDKGVLFHPNLGHSEIRVIEDTLCVEGCKLASLRTFPVGSSIVATNRGAVVTPLAGEKDVSFISDTLGVPADVGTINCGNPYVRIGLVANSKGALIGDETTGPELSRIVDTLGV